MKIIFTGGHHNSALEVARELRRRQPDAELLWLGHQYTRLGEKVLSAEYQEVTGAGIEFVEIRAGKLYKTFNPLHWLRVPYGFLQSLYHLARFKPDLIVSFGGYLAAPVVLAGWLLRVPTVTHEQTTVVGWSNRLIAKVANKIFITWPASERYFPPEKTVLTGLPLRQAIFESEPEKFSFDNDLPTIYITGGKQGSHPINQAILSSLEKLLKQANLVHQVGRTSITTDLADAQAAHSNLPGELKKRYLVKDYVFEDEIGSVFAAADLVISRAGAHTVYELAALGKPALLVPIPWVSHNEQYKNARLLVNQGLARILPEDRLDAESLLAEVSRMLNNLARYQSRASATQDLVQYSATERIVEEILRLVT